MSNVVGGVVIDDEHAEKLLVYVVVRSEDGKCEFPKGHVEDGETGEEAIVRETREEAGITAEVVCEIGEFEGIVYYLLTKKRDAKKTDDGEIEKVKLKSFKKAKKLFDECGNDRDIAVAKAAKKTAKRQFHGVSDMREEIERLFEQIMRRLSENDTGDDTLDLNDENWSSSKKSAQKTAKTVARRYGKGFAGKTKWASKWADNPAAAAAALTKKASGRWPSED